MGSGRIGRRDFLRGTAATVGLGAVGVAGRVAAEAGGGEPAIRRYVPLGRTGFEISDISFGSSRMADPALPIHALERGINYFDTAEGYKGGDSEEAIGRSLVGQRERYVLASKTKCADDTTREELMAALEGSLRRLRTDRIDIYFNHAVNDVDRLNNEAWYEFTARAKEQGKIRFTGMSGHGGRLVECLDHAVDNDLIDVILCSYNFGQDPSFLQRFTAGIDRVAVQAELPRVLQKARARGVGVVAMKTLRGARLNDMRPYEGEGSTFAQAAFRWTLSGGNVDALVVSMNSVEMIDEYIGASGAPAPGAAELRLLERHLASDREGTCVQGCAGCESACPLGVPIAEVLRTRMYARGYGDLELAREDYGKLGSANAAACARCTARPCLGACPAGLEIPALTRSTHDWLGQA